MLCDRTLKCILDAFLMPGGTTVKLRRAIERLQVFKLRNPHLL